MRLFTPKERDTVKNIIVEEMKKIVGIKAIILVGSGSVGFTDDISDLDFCIVIDNEFDINVIMNRVNDFISFKWSLMDVLQMQERGLQVYMLNNYLEIDIGYVKFDNVSATRKRWLVLYDTTGKVDSIMEQTWEINKNNHGKKESINIEGAYSAAAEDIWHYLMHAIVGVKRENYWRTIGEMEIARNTLIELLGYKYSLETKRFRDVDKFPDDVKNTLQKTIPTMFNSQAFKDSIYFLTDAIYDELEAYYSKNSKIKVTREDVKEYCNDILENK